MYNISNELKEAIKESNRTIDAKVYVNDTILTTEQIINFTIDSSIGNSDVFTIGSTTARKLTLNVIIDNITPTLWTTQPIRPYIGFLVGSEFEYIPLGVFYPEQKSIKKTDNSITIECFDKLTFLDTFEYISALTYPTTTIDMLNEISSQTNITVNTTNLTSIQWATKPKSKSIRYILSEICELYAANCILDRTGTIECITPQEVAFNINSSNYISYSPLSDSVSIIDKLIVKKNENNIVVGVGTNDSFQFENENINSQAELQSIYNKLFPFSFYPYNMECQGMPHLDCGDIIEFTNKNNEQLDLLIVTHKLVFNGSVKSTFTCSTPQSQTSIGTTGVGSITKSINTLKTDVIETQTILTNTIEADNSRFNNLETNKADINLANIEDGCITTAMISSGAIETVQIADGSITDAKIVELNANKINAGTLSVERLEIVGSNSSIVYALNNSGSLISQNVNTINGNVLTDRTITADKIVAKAITSNEIASNTITANNIASNTITGSKIVSGTLTSTQINTIELWSNMINANTISANKIVGGTLSLGGSNNFNGSIEVYNANNILTTSINKDGINLVTDLSSTFCISTKDNINTSNVWANGFKTINKSSTKYSLITTDGVFTGTETYINGSTTITQKSYLTNEGISTQGYLTVSGNATVNGVLNAYGLFTQGHGVLTDVGGIKKIANPTNTYLEITCSNGIVYGINWWVSDTKLKKNIADTNIIALDKINKLNFVQFDWKSTEKHQALGLTANQVKEVIPEGVYEVKQSNDSEYDSILNLDISILTAYGLKAIQELNNKIKELENKING